jgi:hypothetical protein
LVKCCAFNPVAAVLSGRNIKPMITLDLMVSLGNILPGDLFVHAIHGTYDFRGDSVPGECEHQSTWQRRCGLESTDGGVISMVICQAPVRLFDKNS